MSIYRTLRILVAASLLLGVAPSGPRIVTLVPSLAEDAFAIGANVIAVSKFTDDMPAAKGLPVVADFQSVDSEAIIRLHPDVVVGLPFESRLVEPLRRAGIRVELIADDTFDDIFLDITKVGELSNHRAQALALNRHLHEETNALRKSVKLGRRPSVFFAFGTGPIWTAGAGSYIGKLAEFAGGRNAASDLHAPWGEYSEEALLRAQPDVIIAGHETDLHDVLNREPWKSLRAVREGHVIEINDVRINQVLYRPGPHYNEGLRWLIERLSSLSTPTTKNVH